MAVTFRIRRDTAANWTTANPILGLGEPGLETDTRKVKYGDGATAWSSLGYSAADVRGLTAFIETLLDDPDAATALATLKAGGLVHPGYVAGRYYWPMSLGAMNSSVSPGLNTLRVSPFILSQPVTVSELFSRVTAVGTGNCRLCVYASNGTTHLPSGLPLAVTGNLSTASIANVSGAIVGGNVLLPAGLYWGGAMTDNAAAAIQGTTQATSRYGAYLGSATLSNIESATNVFYVALSIAVTFGTFPNLTTTPPAESVGIEIAVGFKAG